MSLRRRIGSVAAAACALPLLVACGGEDETSRTEASSSSTSSAGRSAPASVTIVGFAFSPKSITVAAGTELAVVNEDDAPHTLTAEDGSFDTGSLDGGDEGTVALEEPGEYAVFCEIHQYMRGSITVE